MTIHQNRWTGLAVPIKRRKTFLRLNALGETYVDRPGADVYGVLDTTPISHYTLLTHFISIVRPWK